MMRLGRIRSLQTQAFVKYILRPEVLEILVNKFLATVFVKLYSVHLVSIGHTHS